MIVQVLGFEAHGAVDARAAARMIEQDELFDQAGIELPVFAEFQRDGREAIGLARGVQAEDIGLVLVAADDVGSAARSPN